MLRYDQGVTLAGVLAGALLARLIALLFAARPDHPVLALLLTLTAPLTAPFRWLDRLAGQPQFGARLELATLAALALLVVIMMILHWSRASRATPQPEDTKHA